MDLSACNRNELFKKVCRLAGNAIKEYGLIREGDRILAAVSGGKDSLVMLLVLRHFQKIAPVKFHLEAATFDPGFPGFASGDIAAFCEGLRIRHHCFPFDMKTLLEIKGMQSNPCMLCSRMRRGCLYSLAKEQNFNKLALGQHLDDCAVSFLMSLCRGAGLSTMGPNVAQKQGNLRVIRPLILTPEKLIRELAQDLDLPLCGTCLYKEKVDLGDRKYFADLLQDLSGRIPDLLSNMKCSLGNIQEKHLLDKRFLSFDDGMEAAEEEI